MIAKQTVFLTLDRSRAVVESDPEAKFLLCRAGLEIADKVAQQYTDAVALLSAKAVKPVPTLEEVVGGENREEDLTLQNKAPKPPKAPKCNKPHPLGG